MSVVAKVREKAAVAYEQAKAKYADRNAWQHASHMTNRIRDLSGKASASPLAGKLRDASGKASASPLAGKLRDASGKATAAMRDARARRHSHQ